MLEAYTWQLRGEAQKDATLCTKRVISMNRMVARLKDGRGMLLLTAESHVGAHAVASVGEYYAATQLCVVIQRLLPSVVISTSPAPPVSREIEELSIPPVAVCSSWRPMKIDEWHQQLSTGIRLWPKQLLNRRLQVMNAECAAH